jgi:hypothetical protein
MEDSVEKKPSENPEAKPQGTSVEMVRHMGTDKLSKRIRGEGGKFVKQPKTMPKSEDMTRYIRNVLNRAEANEDGVITKGSKSRISRMISNIIKNAEMDAEQPVYDKCGNQTGTAVDPKIMMASAQNFKEIMLRGYGAPSKSDEELNAMKTQSVKVIVLSHPELMDKTVVEDKPHEKPVPAFIDAEIIENK